MRKPGDQKLKWNLRAVVGALIETQKKGSKCCIDPTSPVLEAREAEYNPAVPPMTFPIPTRLVGEAGCESTSDQLMQCLILSFCGRGRSLERASNPTLLITAGEANRNEVSFVPFQTNPRIVKPWLKGEVHLTEISGNRGRSVT